MSIPVGKEYMNIDIGIGKLANYQDTQADSAVVDGAIPFGSAVQVIDGTATLLTENKFYGVAIAKEFVPELTGEKVGNYFSKEMVPVLRRGTICVLVEEDVLSGEKAVVNTATGTFLPSTTATSTRTDIVGVFKTTAQAGGLAHLEINLP
ncbi:structural cement protein Gp24 [Listeria seeligeri]|uniref:structural cement protein Gp24 n=1 Tax=Listeria seeligeri TaxID=1640 RepID=UPI001625DEA0|nr:hypothetical protein [Listeria seeligeri]MBC1722257.1 hypothetical protein [Listeria seeligeri]MBF2435784.1 hypothetical protein [Listeria seeligeri]MBM5675601.1 hypothetical protein [Listeria seeligeri]